jgi:4-hydroxy-3-methylbut-2-enyl diphosphate reductase
MVIEIDEKSGFCFGVVKAISKAEESIRLHREVYCLGDIVHNQMEVSRLKALGLHSVKKEDFPKLTGKIVFIRAHGEPPSTYALAEHYGVRLIDATCPVVTSIQRKIRAAREQMQANGGQVVILGKKGHAEVAGLTGQVDERAIVVENIADLAQIDFTHPIHLLSQTTRSLTLFEQVKFEILHRAQSEVVINNTICREVSNRNAHLSGFARRFDVALFVSDRKSSNGQALFEVCKKANPRSHHIESPADIDSQWFADCRSVGISGATSTPKWLMIQIAETVTDLDCRPLLN